eukprot:GHVU01228748.1.p1 GENE.GHVU01228748.1~~GHVU01228748.1.p1  ORF type:complete len:429 (-),score=19.71 GHVU01228748.1:184-1470(-)
MTSEVDDVSDCDVSDTEFRCVDERQRNNEWRRRLKCRLSLLLLIGIHQLTIVPAERFSRARLEWEVVVYDLLREPAGSFEGYYRMTLEMFMVLRALLDPLLQRDAIMAYVSCERTPIDATIILHCTLRWLAGGSMQDLKASGGISKRSFYRSVHAGMVAICVCDTLSYHFPSTLQEIHEAAYSFALLSSHRVVRGCVGAIDGLLVRIRAPRSRETGHVRSYFSGHYHCFGVNVIGVVDHMCRFIHVAVARPGGSSDLTAFNGSAVKPLIERLPHGRFVVGDNAYVCTETLITPYSGSDADPPSHDTFNYHLSQPRIRVEQAFGFMTTRWGIMHKPLRVRLRNLGLVVMTISRVHNFVITHRNRAPEEAEIRPMHCRGVEYKRGYLRTRGNTRRVATTTLRQQMVAYIEENALTRPEENIRRRENEDSE